MKEFIGRSHRYLFTNSPVLNSYDANLLGW